MHPSCQTTCALWFPQGLITGVNVRGLAEPAAIVAVLGKMEIEGVPPQVTVIAAVFCALESASETAVNVTCGVPWAGVV
jgi:hypothetical protein